jgi:hypothetical protein
MFTTITDGAAAGAAGAGAGADLAAARFRGAGFFGARDGRLVATAPFFTGFFFAMSFPSSR